MHFQCVSDDLWDGAHAGVTLTRVSGLSSPMVYRQVVSIVLLSCRLCKNERKSCFFFRLDHLAAPFLLPLRIASNLYIEKRPSWSCKRDYITLFLFILFFTEYFYIVIASGEAKVRRQNGKKNRAGLVYGTLDVPNIDINNFISTPKLLELPYPAPPFRLPPSSKSIPLLQSPTNKAMPQALTESSTLMGLLIALPSITASYGSCKNVVALTDRIQPRLGRA